MNSTEMARRFKAAIDDLDLGEDDAWQLAAPLMRAAKAANGQRVAFKEQPLSPLEQFARQSCPALYGEKRG